MSHDRFAIQKVVICRRKAMNETLWINNVAVKLCRTLNRKSHVIDGVDEARVGAVGRRNLQTNSMRTCQQFSQVYEKRLEWLKFLLISFSCQHFLSFTLNQLYFLSLQIWASRTIITVEHNACHVQHHGGLQNSTWTHPRSSELWNVPLSLRSKVSSRYYHMRSSDTTKQTPGDWTIVEQ